MLKKKERLNREAFNRFFSIGKRVHSPTLTLIYTPHTQLHASVVVSKKVSTRAVRRNKLRRQIYDIVRLSVKAERKTGIFILILKPTGAHADFQGLKKEILSLINQLPNKGTNTQS